MVNMRNLYLFDIDGTIVDMTDVHITSYRTAYQSTLGIDIEKDTLVKRFGLPERSMHEDIFEELKIPYKDKINELIKKYEVELLRALESLKIMPLPGVEDFLNYLKNHEQYLGIVTGNKQSTGSRILKKANLYDFFTIFSWGDNIGERTELVKNAINHANERSYEFNKIIVIGDSPVDIESGKSVGAFTVGVTTGYNNKYKLRDADLVLETLVQYKKILEALK